MVIEAFRGDCLVESKEKKMGDRAEGSDFETYLAEKMTNGNLSLKRGKFSVYLEISKIVSWENGKGQWANIRVERQDILVLKRFVNEACEFLKKNVDDPFGLEALKKQLEEAKA